MMLEFQEAQNLGVQSLAAEFNWHGVDGVHVFHGYDAGFGYVAEERDFLFQVGGDVTIAAAQQNVGLDTDAEQFFYAVLSGLGFQFTGSGDKGNERHMDEERVFCAEFEAHLTDGFEEGKRFDVADRAADFDDYDVHGFGNFPNGGFDFVSDVGDDLNGFAEEVAAALFGEDGFVDTAGGPVVIAGKLGMGEA